MACGDVEMWDLCEQDVSERDVSERETLTSMNKSDARWDRECWEKARMAAAPRALAAAPRAHAHCAALAAYCAEHQRRLDALCDAVSRLQVAVEALRGAGCVRCGAATAL